MSVKKERYHINLIGGGGGKAKAAKSRRVKGDSVKGEGSRSRRGR